MSKTISIAKVVMIIEQDEDGISLDCKFTPDPEKVDGQYLSHVVGEYAKRKIHEFLQRLSHLNEKDFFATIEQELTQTYMVGIESNKNGVLN